MREGRSYAAQTAGNPQPHTQGTDACELFLAELQVHRALLAELLQKVNIEVSRQADARMTATRSKCKRHTKRTF